VVIEALPTFYCDSYSGARKPGLKRANVVVHNHPSGDPTPSPEDIKVTEQIVKAGKLLDIEVLDHLIIGRQRYISLKERGLGFPST